MSQISTEEIAHLARLASIELPPEKMAKMAEEISVILEHVRTLDTIPTEGVDPTYQISGLMNVTREDEIIDYGVSQEVLLQNAHASQNGSIKVERVL
jgi:aspartyl-tRNA(Asn)/glutamyl-tRNA(Gln) amidotransferase subunit C